MSADNWTYCPACFTKHDVETENYTMREDYQQGMDSDGIYECHYSCVCKRCRFQWEKHYQETVNIPTPIPKP